MTGRVRRRRRQDGHDMFDKSDTSPPRRTALVADDDEGLRLLVRLALENNGWVVEEAEDGASACLAVERLHPDIVLLDVEMPELDGLEACARLRSLPGGKYVPVLMITGMDDKASISRAYEVGATDFLSKPFNLTVLTQRVQYMYRSSQASRALHNERDFVSMIVGTSAALMVVLDPQGRVIRFNSSCERVSGYSEREAQGMFVWDIPSDREGDDRERMMFEQLVAERATNDYQGLWTTKEGDTHQIAWSNSVFVNSDGFAENVIYTGLDVTDRNQAEERIRFLDSYDPLTGLPNRRLTTERLREVIASADEDGLRLAVIVLDLDRFKHINAILGHGGGNLVLSEVAKRLAKSLRLSDMLSRRVSDVRMELGRIGGDEFTVLLPGVPDANAVAAVIERLQESLARPIRVEDQLEVNIGIPAFELAEPGADHVNRFERPSRQDQGDDETQCQRDHERGDRGAECSPELAANQDGRESDPDRSERPVAEQYRLVDLQLRVPVDSGQLSEHALVEQRAKRDTREVWLPLQRGRGVCNRHSVRIDDCGVGHALGVGDTRLEDRADTGIIAQRGIRVRYARDHQPRAMEDGSGEQLTAVTALLETVAHQRRQVH